MSKYTIDTLNNGEILVGYVAQRGRAWWARKGILDGEPNHYEGAIPVADVQRRLFSWTAEEVPVYQTVPVADPIAASLVSGPQEEFQSIPGRKGIRRSDDFTMLGIHSGTPGVDGYKPHQYGPWLLGNIANLLSDELGVGTAGLLGHGACAWVQVEVPENLSTKEGVTFRPNLLAHTSLDGSSGTGYYRTATIVVCDNTLTRALNEKGKAVRIRHTRNSELKIEDARKALQIVELTGADMTAEISRLCSWPVETKAWKQLVELFVPIPEDPGRGKTIAEAKREQLNALYMVDERVAPWQGTAWGVSMAFNTWGQHYATVRNVSRAERTMSNAILQVTSSDDDKVLKALAEIAPVPSYAA